MERKLWIIAISNSDGDGVDLYKKYFTTNTIKKFLVKIAKADAESLKEDFEYGTENIEDLRGYGNRIDAYNVFNDYHIEYSDIALDDINKFPKI